MITISTHIMLFLVGKILPGTNEADILQSYPVYYTLEVTSTGFCDVVHMTRKV